MSVTTSIRSTATVIAGLLLVAGCGASQPTSAGRAAPAARTAPETHADQALGLCAKRSIRQIIATEVSLGRTIATVKFGDPVGTKLAKDDPAAFDTPYTAMAVDNWSVIAGPDIAHDSLWFQGGSASGIVTMTSLDGVTPGSTALVVLMQVPGIGTLIVSARTIIGDRVFLDECSLSDTERGNRAETVNSTHLRIDGTTVSFPVSGRTIPLSLIPELAKAKVEPPR